MTDELPNWPPEERRDEHGTPYWGRVVNGQWQTNPDILEIFAAVQRALEQMHHALKRGAR